MRSGGKAGFKDKVSIDELVNYVLEETNQEPSKDEIRPQMQIVGVEGITEENIMAYQSRDMLYLLGMI